MTGGPGAAPEPVEVPERLTINAWTGPLQPADAGVDALAGKWGARGSFPKSADDLAGPAPVPDESDWRHPSVGWGIVLAEPGDGWTAAQKAVAADAAEPVRRLVAERGTPYPVPVFRYAPDLGAMATQMLRRYFPDGTAPTPAIGGPRGVGTNAIPLYLLIVGGPDEIPWDLQYALCQRHYVGRLDLDDDGLANYVDALLSDWAGANADPMHAVVWAVDAGIDGDITREMRLTVSHPVYQRLVAGDLMVGYCSDDAATVDNLVTELTDRTPGLVVTTSHGKTSPLGDPAQMAAGLGLPVGGDDGVLDPATLTGAWSPGGAVWYAHACCSAGSDVGTSYAGLLAQGDRAYQVVTTVGELGARTAPLPRALLGAPQPLRAFIGQVEPTFDWTLRYGPTRQQLTDDLKGALYEKLLQPWPVGRAFGTYHASVGHLYTQWASLSYRVNAGDDALRPLALRTRLTAVDRQSLVILGDPTAALPPLP